MFGGGLEEIGLILFVAFLLFGPKKLPEIARILGKGMGELRRARNELTFSLEEEVRKLELDRTHLAEDISKTLDIDRYSIESPAESVPAYGYDHTVRNPEEPEPKP